VENGASNLYSNFLRGIKMKAFFPHQRLSAHFKIRNFKFSAARARALLHAACCDALRAAQ
jgi:hypothetical protein